MLTKREIFPRILLMIHNHEENWFIEAQASLNVSVDSAEHGNLRIVVDNQNYDTVVWGNGPTDVGTWSGVSVTPPAQDLEDLVYMRGDGCLFLPDSNTAEDWKMRWSIEGASQLCTQMLTSVTSISHH